MRLLKAFFLLFYKASAQSLAMRAVYRISVYVQLSGKILQQGYWVSLPQGRSAAVQAFTCIPCRGTACRIDARVIQLQAVYASCLAWVLGGIFLTHCDAWTALASRAQKVYTTDTLREKNQFWRSTVSVREIIERHQNMMEREDNEALLPTQHRIRFTLSDCHRVYMGPARQWYVA